jgi:hypothetical protein
MSNGVVLNTPDCETNKRKRIGIMDTYPDKSELERYDDAERAAIEKADQRLDEEKNRIQEGE